MNIFKQLLQKIGLIVSVVLLWLLDDLLIILPETAVWPIVNACLALFGRGDRKDALHDYWVGRKKK